MYAAIRRYRVNPDASSRVIGQIVEDFAPQLAEQVEELRAYYVLDAGNGAFATVTICDRQDGLQECTRMATEWTKQYLVDSIQSSEELSGFFVEIGETIEGFLHEGAQRFSSTQFPQEDGVTKRAPQEASTSAERSQGEQLLSVREVCELLGMGRSWVCQQIRSTELPSVHLGGSVKVKRDDLEEYIQRQRRSSPAQDEEEYFS